MFPLKPIIKTSIAIIAFAGIIITGEILRSKRKQGLNDNSPDEDTKEPEKKKETKEKKEPPKKPEKTKNKKGTIKKEVVKKKTAEKPIKKKVTPKTIKQPMIDPKKNSAVKVKDGNSCIGCKLLSEFPKKCGDCDNIIRPT